VFNVACFNTALMSFRDTVRNVLMTSATGGYPDRGYERLAFIQISLMLLEQIVRSPEILPRAKVHVLAIYIFASRSDCMREHQESLKGLRWLSPPCLGNLGTRPGGPLLESTSV
jgi:hypothetical protein